MFLILTKIFQHGNPNLRLLSYSRKLPSRVWWFVVKSHRRLKSIDFNKRWSWIWTAPPVLYS